LYCVFAKYTVQARLSCSLNPKFYTGKRYKLYANFTFCFTFWGDLLPRPLSELCLWTPLGDFRPPDPLARPPPREPPPLYNPGYAYASVTKHVKQVTTGNKAFNALGYYLK